MTPGWEAKTPHVSWPKHQNIKQKLYCKKFNKDLINDSHKKNHKKKKIEATSLGLRATEDVSKNKDKKEDGI